MKNKFLALIFLSVSFHLDAKVTHIFIDINLLLETCTKAATKEVGAWNSTKYLAFMGKIPCKADFFKALQNCPAESNQLTYNENLTMPFILSDWLTGNQKNNVIKSKIYTHLDRSNLSDIEKIIFKNITNMMLTPATFVGTQLLKKDIVKIIQKLQKSGLYTVHLIGNWDKESEPFLIKLLQNQSVIDAQHCIFSNKLKELKPNPSYFTALLDYSGYNPKDCLIVEVEKKHIQGATNAGIATILINGQSASQLKHELARNYITI